MAPPISSDIRPVTRIYVTPENGRLDASGRNDPSGFIARLDDGYSPGLHLQATSTVTIDDSSWVSFGLQLPSKTESGKRNYVTDVEVCYKTSSAVDGTGVGQIRLAKLVDVSHWLVEQDDAAQPDPAPAAPEGRCVISKLSEPARVDGPFQIELRLEAAAPGEVIEIGKLSVGLGVDNRPQDYKNVPKWLLDYMRSSGQLDE